MSQDFVHDDNHSHNHNHNNNNNGLLQLAVCPVLPVELKNAYIHDSNWTATRQSFPASPRRRRRSLTDVPRSARTSMRTCTGIASSSLTTCLWSTRTASSTTAGRAASRRPPPDSSRSVTTPSRRSVLIDSSHLMIDSCHLMIDSCRDTVLRGSTSRAAAIYTFSEVGTRFGV